GAEDGRPQRERRRSRDEDRRRHRPQHGHHGRRVSRLKFLTRSLASPVEEPAWLVTHELILRRINMAQKSKAYRAAAEKIEDGKFYTPAEAVGIARETGSKKFDSTVEVALKLNVDPRKRSEEHTSELQSRENLVCRLL